MMKLMKVVFAIVVLAGLMQVNEALVCLNCITSGCTTTTTCADTDKYCLNTYLANAAVTKGCAPACTEAMVSGTGTTCCSTDKCNSGVVEKSNMMFLLSIAFASLALIKLKLNF